MDRRSFLCGVAALPVAVGIPAKLPAQEGLTVAKLKRAKALLLANHVPDTVLIWPQTLAEWEDGIWPGNCLYPPGHPQRYT